MDWESLIQSPDNNFKDFLFYDIEVFKKDALVVFKDIDGQTVKVFHNNFDGLGELIKDKILVGYNNYHYDDYILTEMILKKSNDRIKELNDGIIGGGFWTGHVHEDIISLDCFQQINVAKSSLKKVEANIGLSIDESAVDFNINRRLNQEELAATIKYCKQDVNATIAIFKLRWFSYFVPKFKVVKMLDPDLQDKAVRWNTTTITATLLRGNSKADPQWEWSLGDQKWEDELLSLVPKEAAQMWHETSFIDLTAEKPMKKRSKYTHIECNCSFEFSQGGLHGVDMSGRSIYRNVKLLDVTSLYPNILIKIGALGDATEKYKEILDQRVKVKHSDQVLSNALKLVINSTYGLMKNKYSKLYNPMAALSVCIYGQIILFDLCRRLQKTGCMLVNVNTDGVAFIPKDDEWLTVQKEWEDKYGFELELSEFKTWTQKDVNNYVAVTKSGDIKVKGAEVNHYFDPTDYLSDPLHCKAGVTWSGTNTKSIIHHCIVDKLVYNRDFENTILENLDKPILFQYVLQCGSTYIGTIDEDGNEYQKVNRVFATKNGVTLKKLKEGCNPQYFPNAPKEMYVYNGDLRDFKNFGQIIDIGFYRDLAEEKYNNLWT